MTSHYRLFVVSHTHWDREWYQPFEAFRMRLVRLVDRLLDLLQARPEYACFMLDGQTIILDDYLAVRPEREEELRDLIGAGRILIGPWHILPDEFLVGSEASVRNLLMGAVRCRRFDAVLPIGYIPDSFGHISQLPQLLRGFGFETAAFQRGVPDAPTEFRWIGPDGSQVLVLNLRDGYGNLAWLPLDTPSFVAAVRAEADRLRPHATTHNLLLLNGTDHQEPLAELPDLLEAARPYLDDEILHSTLSHYAEAVRRELDDSLGELPILRGEFRCSQRSNILPGVLSARMWIKQRNQALEQLMVAWAEPLHAWVLAAGCDADVQGLGAHLRLGWDYLVQNHPHDSICGCSVDQVHEEMRVRFDRAEQIGSEVLRRSMTALASRIDVGSLVLQDTTPPAPGVLLPPPPAIPIHLFNPTSWPQAGAVEVEVQVPPNWRDVELVDEAGAPLLWQLLGREHTDFSVVGIEHFELLSRLHLEHGERIAGQGIVMLSMDEDGNEAPRVHLVLGAHGRPALAVVAESLAHLRRRLDAWDGQPSVAVTMAPVLRLALVASQLAPHSYTTIYLRPLDQSHGATASAGQPAGRVMPGTPMDLDLYAQAGSVNRRPMTDAPGTGVRPFSTQRAPSAVHSAETTSTGRQFAIRNEHLRVEVNPDGTLTVVELASGRRWPGLHRFVDEGDRGDEYNFDAVPGDRPLTTAAAAPDVSLLETGPARQSLEIRQVFRLPAALATDRSQRADEPVDVAITTCVSLAAGTRRVEFRTTIDNRARDHRLRVHFPTPLAATESLADGHWHVLRRPVELPADSETWPEQPVGYHPQRAWCAVAADGVGLMLANRGLPEYEVLPPGPGTDRSAGGVTLCLTLLRCVGWLSRPDLRTRKGHAGPGLPTPGAQMLGRWTFDYALIPFEGDWQTAARDAYTFNTPLRALVGNVQHGDLPTSQRLISLEPASLCVSAIKWAEEGGGLIVRVFNGADTAVEGHLQVHLPWQQVSTANLAEQTGEAALDIPPGAPIPLDLNPWQVATLKFSMPA